MYFTWHTQESLKYHVDFFNRYRDSYFQDKDLIEYLFNQTGYVREELVRWLSTGELPITRDITIDARAVPGRRRINVLLRTLQERA